MLNKKYFNIKNLNNFNKILLNNQTFIDNNDNNLKLNNILNKYKNYINKINLNNWNKYKIYTFNYEYVYNVKNNLSLVKYKPISRSYFKLCELVNDCIELKNKKMYFCFLAESPGGFIDYIIKSRKHYLFKDEYYTISLLSNNSSIPNFKNLNEKYNNVNILLGYDNTGNLCNIENIKYLKNKLNVDFVTADGGFDFTNNYEEQENNIYKLLFCEIITALSILNKNGYFILKVFDLYSIYSINLVYLLSLYFENIKITKPHLSKPANSEKYIICLNFKGINNNELELFYNMIIKNKKINLDIPKEFILFITNVNLYYTILQISNILHTLILYQLEINYFYRIFINFKQFIFSIIWCIKYNQIINYDLMFFKLNYRKKIFKLLFSN